MVTSLTAIQVINDRRSYIRGLSNYETTSLRLNKISVFNLIQTRDLWDTNWWLLWSHNRTSSGIVKVEA